MYVGYSTRTVVKSFLSSAIDAYTSVFEEQLFVHSVLSCMIIDVVYMCKINLNYIYVLMSTV